MLKVEIYKKLLNPISEFKWFGAIRCFKTHWNLDKSIVNIPRMKEWSKYLCRKSGHINERTTLELQN